MGAQSPVLVLYITMSFGPLLGGGFQAREQGTLAGGRAGIGSRTGARQAGSRTGLSSLQGHLDRGEVTEKDRSRADLIAVGRVRKIGWLVLCCVAVLAKLSTC